LNRKNAGAGKPELVARIGLETGPVVPGTRYAPFQSHARAFL
jgi:hypothetical protein